VRYANRSQVAGKQLQKEKAAYIAGQRRTIKRFGLPKVVIFYQPRKIAIPDSSSNAYNRAVHVK
jgi:hypothetical protein